MIIIIDNYDSFTYNLYQEMGTIEPDLIVLRNDAASVSAIRDMKPDGIILSPGPGRPENAGICPEIVREMRGELPILGVCLGEQVICHVYGAVVGYALRLMHGRQSVTSLDMRSPLFKGLPEKIPVARYHSLAVQPETIPGTGLMITGIADDGEIMSVEDPQRRVYGLQYHPESVMTPDGMKILENFRNICMM